jgi:uncharacterized membrane protein
MLAITTNSIVVFLHIFFVILFLGVTYSFIFVSNAAQAAPEHGLFALGINRKIQETLVIPGGVLIFATGLYLSIADDWFSKDDIVWLHVSMTWFIIAWLVGTFVAYPSVKTMQRELETKEGPGPPSDLFLAKRSLMNKVGPFLGFSVLGITFLMVTKPF